MFEFLIMSQTQRGAPCELSEGLSAERVRGWAASAEIAAAITRERASEGSAAAGGAAALDPLRGTRVRGGVEEGDEDEQSERRAPISWKWSSLN